MQKIKNSDFLKVRFSEDSEKRKKDFYDKN